MIPNASAILALVRGIDDDRAVSLIEQYAHAVAAVAVADAVRQAYDHALAMLATPAERGVAAMTSIPTQTECQRCERLFCYFRSRRPRIYCAPCVELERRDANLFFTAWAKQKRQKRVAHA